MRLRFILSAILFLMVIPVGIGGTPAKNDKQKEAEALLAKARELSDIRADGTPPYEMSARVRFIGVPNGPVEGIYSELRDLTGRDRKVLEIPEWNYVSIEIHQKDSWYRSGSTRYVPYFESQLRILLDPGGQLKLLSLGSGISISRLKASGRSLTCVSAKVLGSKNESCFDPASGTLDYTRSRMSDLNWTYEFSEYGAFVDKQFPLSMRFKEQEKVILEVEVDHLNPNPDMSPSLFIPPPNADHWLKCDDPTPPEAVEKPEPRYTSQARNARARGRVLVYMVVGTDGRAHNVTPVQAVELSLAKSTLDTIGRRWRFKPATCNGQPIPTGIFVETVFSLF